MICEAAIGRCWVFGPEVEMFLEPALTCGGGPAPASPPVTSGVMSSEITSDSVSQPQFSRARRPRPVCSWSSLRPASPEGWETAGYHGPPRRDLGFARKGCDL